MLAIAVTRTRSAPVKHAVWTVVVCAMLALPLLSVALPPIPLRVLKAAPLVIEPLPVVASAPQVAARASPCPFPSRATTRPFGPPSRFLFTSWVRLFCSASLCSRIFFPAGW
ncbi:MAG TPA: hypothetical protein PLA43_03590 [Bryobacteraceae bacterium]|nr:hypothetical protein [Bryobacteraceae bacterium]HOL71350.1 hypothetical protein [Bryobacteraceae bacterium]HOQ47631.1 hypothetical protein [Bryobacteraceae bacterium]HPQ14560.1 hypothetical protein [Bryobacteraceae bacterium]HPU71013.1 hypothetical protein [Bryobacteraceae bacterium]